MLSVYPSSCLFVVRLLFFSFFFFFFNDTATTEIYTLSLHDALPIFPGRRRGSHGTICDRAETTTSVPPCRVSSRSEEHTSELQSQSNLVCRLLLEKKKKKKQLKVQDIKSNKNTNRHVPYEHATATKI